MRRTLYTLTLMVCILCMSHDTFAQRISHTYNNVSLSEALLQLNNEQKEYVINFLYNELEDFRITATVKNKKLPDAIQQMIGFYPVRMTVKPDDHEIYVECTHKTDRHLTGTIIDEQGQPVAYANVAILNPADSTLLGGGVSNEDGYFAIPYEQPTVIARISFVGYKTVYKQCITENIGTIRLQPEVYTLNGVQVKGERIVSGTENGHLVYNMPMLLQLFPADNAYDALTSIPGVSEMDGNIMFSGQAVTLIINGKPTTLSADKVVERLRQMPAAMVAKAEVMPSAPAKYHVRGMAINIVTKDFTGTNQLSGQLMGGWRQHKYGTGYAGGRTCSPTARATDRWSTRQTILLMTSAYPTATRPATAAMASTTNTISVWTMPSAKNTTSVWHILVNGTAPAPPIPQQVRRSLYKTPDSIPTYTMWMLIIRLPSVCNSEHPIPIIRSLARKISTGS